MVNRKNFGRNRKREFWNLKFRQKDECNKKETERAERRYLCHKRGNLGRNADFCRNILALTETKTWPRESPFGWPLPGLIPDWTPWTQNSPTTGSPSLNVGDGVPQLRHLPLEVGLAPHGVANRSHLGHLKCQKMNWADRKSQVRQCLDFCTAD